MNRENISAMSDEHSSWLSALDFYRDELGILKERLTEVAGKNNQKEIGADIEHYENQVKVQGEQLDVLHHDIHQILAKAAQQAQANSAGYIDAGLIKAHDLEKGKFEATEKAINGLRKDFHRFAAKWM